MSFIKKAAKKSVSLKAFLKESAKGTGIKYVSEKGAKHIIYVPYTLGVEVIDGEEVEVKETIAIWQNVHEWNTSDGKYKAHVCLDGVVVDDAEGNLVNDGTCPFCDRLSDSWDIYKYRIEKAQEQGIHGAELDEEKKLYLSERKMKEANNYNYMVVAKFRTDEKGNLIIGADGLPEYDLKVMKQSKSKIDKIVDQLDSSGIDITGAEMVFKYPDKDDPRLLGANVQISPMFSGSNNSVLTKYPKVADKINEEAEKFDWEALPKSFQEWQGMSTQSAKVLMDSSFKAYDNWKEAQLTDTNAEYLEYRGSSATTKAITEHAIASTDPNITFKNALQIDDV